MPAGVFQPYAGVKTSVLIFKKKINPKLDADEKIWFFDMKGDGSSLSKAHKFGAQYKNDIPKLVELWNKDRKEEKGFSWYTKVKDIIENEYILTANAYKPLTEKDNIKHRDPKEILKELDNLDLEIEKQKKKVKDLLKA